MTVPDLGMFEPLLFAVGVVVLAMAGVSAVAGALGAGRDSGETIRAWLKRIWREGPPKA